MVKHFKGGVVVGRAAGRKVLRGIILVIGIASGSITRGDIYQWAGTPDSPTVSGTVIVGGVDPSPNVDLSGRNLNQAYLAGMNLATANFATASLDNACLNNSTLTYANFVSASMLATNFSGADLSFANLGGPVTGANFSNATISSARLPGGTFGLSAQQLCSTQSYKNHDLHQIYLITDFSGWDLSGQNLSSAVFGFRSLAAPGPGAYSHFVGTNFTDAVIAGADLFRAADGGLTASQFYSTASYKKHDLQKIRLGSDLGLTPTDMKGWDFSDQDLTQSFFSTIDLTGASFRRANLVNASLLRSTVSNIDFSCANLRGLTCFSLNGGSIQTNTILPNSTIAGLHLMTNDILPIRDMVLYAAASPIKVLTQMQLDPVAKLKIELHDGNWGSKLLIDPGIPIQLSGTLELGLDSSALISQLIGTPIEIFGWNATLAEDNHFEQVVTDDRFLSDTSNLYSTGVIEITHLGGDANDDGRVDIRDHFALASHWQSSDPLLGWEDADCDGNGIINAADLGILAMNWQVGAGGASSSNLSTIVTSLGIPSSSVPEPTIAGAAVLLGMTHLLRRRRVGIYSASNGTGVVLSKKFCTSNRNR